MISKDIDLSFLTQQPDELELPSKGLPYLSSNPLSSGKIHVRPWITAEEKLIDKFNSGNMYNNLKRLITSATEEKINIDDITMGDFFYILYWIRQLTYGSSYTSSVICPNCGRNVETDIDISKLDVTYLNDFPSTIHVTLPVSKIELTMRFPRLRDVIAASEHSRSEKMKPGYNISKDLYTIALCTTEMVLPNKDKNILTIEDDFVTMITKIWPNLPAKDTIAINNELDKYEHGYVDTITTTCPKCGDPIEQMPVLSPYFFRPINEKSESNS